MVLEHLRYLRAMSTHADFMKRCFQLAAKGLGTASPNPLVGCVIVDHENNIIGEGFHRKAGEPHAEVMAIRSVTDSNRLHSSTLYVNLEPCNHQGLTPPCTNLIVESKISRVVISNLDPFEKVNGTGVAHLRSNGVEVITGILEDEGKMVNRRFFTSIIKQRPYVLLKWARSKDNFMDIQRLNNEKGSYAITGDSARRAVHKWRSEEDAILVGHNTVIIDNPELTTRFYSGKNPIRVILDPKGELDEQYKVFADNGSQVILISDDQYRTSAKQNRHRVFTDLSKDSVGSILQLLHERNIRSVLVEGGKFTLQQFIISGVWDEARLFTGNKHLLAGMPSPDLTMLPARTITHNEDLLDIYYNL